MTMTQEVATVQTPLQRAFLQDVSTGPGDGRTVYGTAVPFDREAEVNDGFGPYIEVFRRGAFSKTIRENVSRIKLCVNHDKLRRLPIGRATTLREDPAGLYAEFRVSRTQEGDEALTLIRDGVADAFSISGLSVKHRERTPGVVERLEVKLTEVSVVAFPAYADALIGGLRNAAGVSADDIDRLVDLLRAQPELVKLLYRLAPAITTAELPVDTALVETATTESPEPSTDPPPEPAPAVEDATQEAKTHPEPPEAEATGTQDEPRRSQHSSPQRRNRLTPGRLAADLEFVRGMAKAVDERVADNHRLVLQYEAERERNNVA